MIFQFHYGSIRFASAGIILSKAARNFNSTMVQLDYAYLQANTGVINISIPLWFN